MLVEEFIEHQRILFENVFRVPYNCIWNGKGYSSISYSNWKAIDYQNMWLGWCECAKKQINTT